MYNMIYNFIAYRQCAFSVGFQRNWGRLLLKAPWPNNLWCPLDLYLYTRTETIEIKTVFLPANVCMLSDKGKHLWGVFSLLVLNQCSRSHFNWQCSFSYLGFNLMPVQNNPQDWIAFWYHSYHFKPKMLWIWRHII